MPDTAIDYHKPIPLFPLDNCVLLPHAAVPLHIFEDRYRAMTRDALDSRGLIAMATFNGVDWNKEHAGNPPIHPCVCIGYIVRHERLDDGRYNILLHGVARARVLEEIEHEPYRLAQLEPLEHGAAMEIDLGDARQRIEQLLNDPLLKGLAAVNTINNWLSDEIPTAAMIDLAILTLCNDTACRYAMLAEPEVHARATWLERHLTDTRETLRVAAKLGKGKSDEGWALN